MQVHSFLDFLRPDMDYDTSKTGAWQPTVCTTEHQYSTSINHVHHATVIVERLNGCTDVFDPGALLVAYCAGERQSQPRYTPSHLMWSTHWWRLRLTFHLEYWSHRACIANCTRLLSRVWLWVYYRYCSLEKWNRTEVGRALIMVLLSEEGRWINLLRYIIVIARM